MGYFPLSFKRFKRIGRRNKARARGKLAKDSRIL